MSHSAAALRELAAVVDLFRRKPRLPEKAACEVQALMLPPLDAAPLLPAAPVLETLRRELQRMCAKGNAAAIPASALRRAPLVFWHGEPQAAGFPGLLDQYLDSASNRPRWLRDLIEAWLRDFAPEKIQLPGAGRAVAALLPRVRYPRLDPWLKAHERFAIFDAEAGPNRVAQALLHDSQDHSHILQATGLHDPMRAEGGYYRAVLRAMLERVPAALRSSTATAAWRRAADALEVGSESRDRLDRILPGTKIRFSTELEGLAARAFLSPWLVSPSSPLALRDEIKAFLVRNLGDPRVERARWEKRAGPDATSLMCSWLASASLEAFLSFISKNADDGQWQYRKKFWRACLKKMPSAQVWVIFGEQLAVQARAIRNLQGSFGHMHGPGMVAQQAVLLMQLGNLVLSEWSNVGPVRAWDKNDRRCPRLYEAAYSAAELRTPCLDFPNILLRDHAGGGGGKGLWHRGGEVGLWQGRAAALLLDKLGLILTQQDYM
jgi:hypothetical protein